MAGNWEFCSLSDLRESPEAHWMRDVMGKKGPQWCTVRLTHGFAGHLFNAYTKKFDIEILPEITVTNAPELEAVALELISDGVGIAQWSFSRLYRLLHEDPDGPIETELLVPQAEKESLENLSCGLEIIGYCEPSPEPDYDQVMLTAPLKPEELPIHSYDGGEVIVAIIDDGIGVANHRFRLPDKKSRIEYFLDMNHPTCCKHPLCYPDPACKKPTAAVDVLGTTWLKDRLDQLFSEHPGDEEAIYRAMCMIDPKSDRRQPARFRNTHGTHVLDLATGYDYTLDAEAEIACRRPIIAVQLPSDVVVDRSDSRMACSLKTALGWIFAAAVELSRRAIAPDAPKPYLPLVLNFSFGVFAGPHDGLGDVEERISTFIRDYRNLPGNPKCEVVLPAGNGLQARATAQLTLEPGSTSEPIRWRVKPDDMTSTFMQIWLPCRNGSRQQVAVSVTPPCEGPDITVWSCLDKALDWKIDGVTYLRIYHQRIARPGGESRERITIAMRPTETESGRQPKCPPGVWTLSIADRCLERATEIDLRIQRDEPIIFERRKGRQSYFDDPGYVRFEEESGRMRNDETAESGLVTRQQTLNAYATGCDTVVVGGYRRSNGEPALYSGSGPATSGRPGPTLAAVSEESPAFRGVIATGTYTGSAAIIGGTSVAAPVVTRALADAFAAGQCTCDVVHAVCEGESRRIVGPHGPYKAARMARHGRGRMVTAKAPGHRTRIDG